MQAAPALASPPKYHRAIRFCSAILKPENQKPIVSMYEKEKRTKSLLPAGRKFSKITQNRNRLQRKLVAQKNGQF
jgi:hypothetical protein